MTRNIKTDYSRRAGLAALAAAPAQQPWYYTPPAQERIDALELEVRQLTKQIAKRPVGRRVRHDGGACDRGWRTKETMMVKKLRFFFVDSGDQAPETLDYFVRQDGSVWRDNYQTCESQCAVVGFENFIMPCPDVRWEVVDT